jgi:hypothetical protein
MIVRPKLANATFADRLNADINDGWIIGAILDRNDEIEGHGPVRTQHDMSAEEIKKIETHYGCKVDMSVPQVKRSPDKTRYWDTFFTNYHRKQAAKNAS